MRYAIYGRVSKDEQDAPAQMERLRAWVLATNGTVVHGSYDEESSRKRLPRREEVLRLARGHRFDAVVVEAVDRWGRGVQDLVNTVSELRAAGVTFFSIRGGFSWKPEGDAQTDFMFHVLAAVAELERGLISERTRRSLASIRASGRALGPPRQPCPSCGLLRPRVARLRRNGRRLTVCAPCKADAKGSEVQQEGATPVSAGPLNGRLASIQPVPKSKAI